MPEREHSKYGTRFQESEALLAVGSNDKEHAYAILADMLPGELSVLARDCQTLARMCDIAADAA
jgi:hypothetical protein